MAETGDEAIGSSVEDIDTVDSNQKQNFRSLGTGKMYAEEEKNGISCKGNTRDKREDHRGVIEDLKEGKESGKGVATSCYSYEGDVCIYTDPTSSYQYKWDEENNKWVPRTSVTDWASINVGEKGTENGAFANVDTQRCEQNVNCTVSATDSSSESVGSLSSSDYVFDGETYIYKDLKSGFVYRWDKDKNEWDIISDNQGARHEVTNKEIQDSGCQKEMEEFNSEKDTSVKSEQNNWHSAVYRLEGDTYLFTDPSDGTVYEWNIEKNAWFPKLDDEFLARYQLNYGIDNPDAKVKADSSFTGEKELQTSEKEATPEAEAVLQRKKKANPPSWFELDNAHNTKVYVSHLPLDITEEEFVEVMQKCGLIMKHPDTNTLKIKLYRDESGEFKGDALCTYIKVESVSLALNILDGYDVRGCKIHVERARFQLKGEYDPSKKPKQKKKQDKEKWKRKQEKLFDWRPDKLRGMPSRHEQIVTIKNMFKPSDFDQDASLILEYQNDLKEECKKFGDVRKVVIYDNHPEGVAQVFFKQPEEATLCVQILNGRWFGGHKLLAEIWDGKTRYQIEETDAERKARIENWNKFLEVGQGNTSKVKEENAVGDEKERIPNLEKGNTSTAESYS